MRTLLDAALAKGMIDDRGLLPGRRRAPVQILEDDIEQAATAYEDEEELKYALKFWFKEFIGNKRITPGRDYRTVDHVEPAIVIIDGSSISILTLSCYATDIDEFRDWRSTMLGVFGSPNAMVVEIGCNGPIEWTKNAPDPKDPSWRR